MRIFNAFYFILMILLILFSLLALIATHLKLSEYNLKINPENIQLYLNNIGQNKALFTGTIAVIATYLGLKRLRLLEESNKEKLKQDYFQEWKSVLELRSKEVADRDPMMVRELPKIRWKIYKSLYDLNFKIENEEKLKTVFNGEIQDHVIFFEQQNEKNIKMGSAHPNKDYSYSFDSFRYLFLGMLDSYYENMPSDLERLYIDQLPKDRTTDEKTFKVALNGYFKTQKKK